MAEAQLTDEDVGYEQIPADLHGKKEVEDEPMRGLTKWNEYDTIPGGEAGKYTVTAPREDKETLVSLSCISLVYLIL